MPTTLYDLSVPTFLQTVKAIEGFLELAVKHCADTRTDPDDFVRARLNIAQLEGRLEWASLTPSRRSRAAGLWQPRFGK
jgi:hypothetical protein